MPVLAEIETPYPGLRPFREDEARYFFGQDIPLEDLRNRLYDQHFVAILGLSGCGKSSLLRAGLLADIRQKRVRGPRPRWLIGYMRPGGDPLHALTDAVCEIESQISTEPRVTAACPLLLDGYGLARFGHEAPLENEQRILIVVDQFEELFRYQRQSATHEAKDRAALFVQLLLEAARDPESRVSVVITMRSEFVGDCSLFYGLAEQVNRGTFLLPKMTRDQIEEVILGPAQEADFQIDPSVVQDLLNETDKQDDGLPLLQHALRRIWERWRHGSRTSDISVTDFHSFETKPPQGTLLIKHHLDDHLDSIYKTFDEDQKQAARLLFRLLSQRDRRGRMIRRPLPFSEIVKYAGVERENDLRFVIEAFRDEQQGRTFLTPGVPEPIDGSVVDISHECLLRRWDRLGKWIDYEHQDAEQFCRLADDADRADRALAIGVARKPLEGPTLENFSQWRKAAKLVGPGWARRYEGSFDPILGRPARSFDAAERYLEWSQREADEKLAREKLAEEGRIRSEERAGRAEAEAELVKERLEVQQQLDFERRQSRRRRIATGVVLVLLALGGAVSVFVNQSRQAALDKKAADVKQGLLESIVKEENARRALAEGISGEAQRNADLQKRLREDQSKTNEILQHTVENLTSAQDQLAKQKMDLEATVKQLDEKSSALADALAESREQRGLAEIQKANAERSLQVTQDLRQQLATQKDWLTAVLDAGAQFGDSYRRTGADRTRVVLAAFAALEKAADAVGPAAESENLYRTRKAGLQALEDTVVPRLVVKELRSGLAEAACYDERSSNVITLLHSGGVRRSDSPSQVYLLFGSSGGEGSLPYEFARLVLWPIRRIGGELSLYRDLSANANALADNCASLAVGSVKGLIDRFPTDSPFKNVKGTYPPYLFPLSGALKQGGRIEMARLSSDGEYLVAASAGKGWAAWNSTSRKMISHSWDDKIKVTAAAFSPDNRWMLLDVTGRVLRYDVSSTTFSGVPAQCCNNFAPVKQPWDISNDGSIAWFTASSPTVLYRDSSGTVTEYTRPGNAINAVRLSPDGSLIAAGRGDGSVDVWRVGANNEKPTHLSDQFSPTSPVAALSWAQSGQYLTVLHDTGTARVWRLKGKTTNIEAEPLRNLLRQIETEAASDKPKPLSAEMLRILSQ
jgi:hypothetical protein